MKRPVMVLAAVLALGLVATACNSENGGGGDGLTGTVRVDGSSTVGPLTEAAAERFQQENSGVRVTVGTSGTSGGFEKFCNGETDISDASRPIKDTEIAKCGDEGVEYAEVQVANDALSAVVHPDNPLDCISVEALKQVWDLDSKVDSWGDIAELGAELPDEEVTLFGPGSDSGTYDYWTEAVNGEEGRIRTDYNSIGEDDEAAINGVTGDPWAMAYIPYSFVTEAGERVKALQVKNPESGECVAPTAENVQNGTYTPLGRPLFIYPSAEALDRPEVVEFIEFYIENQAEIAESQSFIPLNAEQVADSQEKVASLSG